MIKFINLHTMTEEATIQAEAVLCLGNFDGVHIGHRQLVASVSENHKALKTQYPALVTGAWFFDSGSYKHADDIYSLEEKLSVFASLGLDYAIIASFDEMKSLSPYDFVEHVLKRDCKCVHAVCGENFRFGAKASGDCETLNELMSGNVTVVPLLSIDEGDTSIVISSTYIRSLLEIGNISLGNKLLGENYSVCEAVLHGKKLGRTIGIPTINQIPNGKKIILKSGIYATVCTLDDKKYYGVTNVGIRPTVEDNGRKNIETFIIDYNGDCYGKSVKIEFIERIRDEMKFEDINALKNQINKDIIKVKEIFNC